MKVRGYFLPPQIKIQELRILEFDQIQVEVPVLTPDLICRIADHLITFHERVLVIRPMDTILKAIDSTIRKWHRRSDPRRRIALDALPSITGFSSQMIQRIMERPWADYRLNKLKALLEDKFLTGCILDEFKKITGGKGRAYGPRLTTHILAGNIPGAGIPDLMTAMVLKSSSLVKTSSNEPLLPVLFAESLAEVDPELAQGLAVLWWKGGDPPVEEAAFSRSDWVIASGDDATIQRIRQRVAGRFIGYGHRLSFGLIGKEALKSAKGIARRAGMDVAMYDQQGCLSPHLFYVETGGIVSPKVFARLLADELESLSIKLPRGKISTGSASTLRQLKDTTEMREAAGDEAAVFCGRKGLDWLVVYEGDSTFVPSPLHRVIRIKPLKDFSLLPSLLQTWSLHLQAAGVAVSKNRLKAVAEMLGRLGVNRICPIGRMQEPPIGWHQDGRSALKEMVRWVGLEG